MAACALGGEPAGLLDGEEGALVLTSDSDLSALDLDGWSAASPGVWLRAGEDGRVTRLSVGLEGLAADLHGAEEARQALVELGHESSPAVAELDDRILALRTMAARAEAAKDSSSVEQSVYCGTHSEWRIEATVAGSTSSGSAYARSQFWIGFSPTPTYDTYASATVNNFVTAPVSSTMSVSNTQAVASVSAPNYGAGCSTYAYASLFSWPCDNLFGSIEQTGSCPIKKETCGGGGTYCP